jgi:hypothetical protein
MDWVRAADDVTGAMAGVEFTNGDQPGVRLTKVAAAHSVEPASALKPTVAARAVRAKKPPTQPRSDRYRALWRQTTFEAGPCGA